MRVSRCGAWLVALAIVGASGPSLGAAESFAVEHAASILEEQAAQGGVLAPRWQAVAADLRAGRLTVSEALAVVELAQAVAGPARAAAPVAVATTPSAPSAPAPALAAEDAARAEAMLAQLTDLPTAPPAAAVAEAGSSSRPAPAAATPAVPTPVAPVAAPPPGPTAPIAAVRNENGNQVVMINAGSQAGLANEQRYRVWSNGTVSGRLVVLQVRDDLAMALAIPGTGVDGADPSFAVGDQVLLSAED